MLFEARSIVGGYHAIRIVKDVSLELDSGETLAVLGRNGVGKTTLLRTLMPSIVQSLAEALRTLTRAKGWPSSWSIRIRSWPCASAIG